VQRHVPVVSLKSIYALKELKPACGLSSAHPRRVDREETAYMAQKVIRKFVDDIDGSPAERTFTFTVDGTHYEIDLSSENIKEFNDAIAGFVESARKVKGGGNGRRTRKVSTSSGISGSGRSREQTQAVREWARRQGHSINDRGRIPASIQQAFDQAHQDSH
jgi:Lsr2